MRARGGTTCPRGDRETTAEGKAAPRRPRRPVDTGGAGNDAGFAPAVGGGAEDLPRRLANRLRELDELLPDGDHVLVALSGGPDSTALLHLLVRLAPEFGWQLTAAHFDHGVRPGGPERVSELARRLARPELEVPLVTGRPERPLDPTHAAMRRARYTWLRETARRISAKRVATGHQRDDQAETILFHILRGTGNRGLAGIPARRGPFVRPLLDFGARELHGWLATTGARPFDDPSNRDPRYTRSRLRYRLMPALDSALAGEAADRLVAIGRAAGEVRRRTDRVAALALASMEHGGASEWPVELRAEALRLAGRRHGVRLRGPAVREAAREMLELTSGHALDVGGGLRIERVFDAWRIIANEAPSDPDRGLVIGEPGAGSGVVRLSGRRLRLEWRLDEPGNNPRGSGGTRVALYVPRDHYPLTVRARVPGDRMRLFGGSKKVGRLMAEARIPSRRRATIPLVADRDGRVLCVLAPELADRVDTEAATNAEPNENESPNEILIIEVENA